MFRPDAHFAVRSPRKTRWLGPPGGRGGAPGPRRSVREPAGLLELAAPQEQPPPPRARALSLLPRAGPVPVSRRGRCPAGRSLPRAPAVCPRVPGPVGVSTELLLLRSSISPRPQLLRRCRRPSHGDTSPPAARRAGGFATCGGAGGRQLFMPPPPSRRSGLTAAGAREPRPLRRRTALAERPSGLDCRRRSACLSGTLCVARQAGGTIRLRPAVAEAGSPRRKAICAMCSLYELRPESRDVGRRPASESHRRA